MKDEFVTYDQALALKELGFDEKCFSYYTRMFSYEKYTIKLCRLEQACNHNLSGFSAPLKQQVFKFFRDKYNIYCKIEREFGINERKLNYVGIYFKGSEKGNSPKNTIIGTYTFEEAESKLIDKLIEIAKQQKNGK